MYLKEIPFAEALARAIDGETGIRIAMPRPLEKMSIEEVLNLQKSGACCLLEEEPAVHTVKIEPVPIVTGEPGPVDPEAPPQWQAQADRQGEGKSPAQGGLEE